MIISLYSFVCHADKIELDYIKIHGFDLAYKKGLTGKNEIVNILEEAISSNHPIFQKAITKESATMLSVLKSFKKLCPAIKSKNWTKT